MPIRKRPIHLLWRGPESIAEATRLLARGKSLALSLPHSFHHVLCTRLCDYGKLNGMLSISGDFSLLRKLAEIGGLHEFGRLCESVRLAGAGVRVQSPPPQVHLLSPTATSPVRHAHFRRQPSRELLDAEPSLAPIRAGS
jgi:hypothetical protein